MVTHFCHADNYPLSCKTAPRFGQYQTALLQDKQTHVGTTSLELLHVVF